MLRLDPDPPVDAPHELAADVEAEPRAADAAGHVGVETIELLEDSLLLGDRDAETGVADRKLHVMVTLFERDRHVSAVRRVLDRVVDQVREDLTELPCVCSNGRQRLRGLQHEVDVRRRVHACSLDLELSDLQRIALLDVDAQLAGVELAREQQIVDDLRQPARFLDDDLQQLVTQLGLELDVAAAQCECGAVDRGERRAQLV